MEDADALWKLLLEKNGTWWFRAPLFEVRMKLTECLHCWNGGMGDEYRELLHVIVISRILACRLKYDRESTEPGLSTKTPSSDRGREARRSRP
jgi:hypothetical protein